MGYLSRIHKINRISRIGDGSINILTRLFGQHILKQDEFGLAPDAQREERCFRAKNGEGVIPLSLLVHARFLSGWFDEEMLCKWLSMSVPARPAGKIMAQLNRLANKKVKI